MRFKYAVKESVDLNSNGYPYVLEVKVGFKTPNLRTFFARKLSDLINGLEQRGQAF